MQPAAYTDCTYRREDGDFYPDASALARLARALPASANRFWRMLGRVEGAPAYITNLHPGKPFVQRMGLVLAGHAAGVPVVAMAVGGVKAVVATLRGPDRATRDG